MFINSIQFVRDSSVASLLRNDDRSEESRSIVAAALGESTPI